MKKSHRYTIMDGRVITFAQYFEKEDGLFNPIWKAVGYFEVSASRNKVVIHYCSIREEITLREFQQALALAWEEHKKLKACSGHPPDGWNGEPIEITNQELEKINYVPN